MITIDLPAAIDEFWEARERGEYFPQAYFDRLALADAYSIQLGLIERRSAAGESQIGWKVGLTAKAIQEQFGFHEPVFGCILEAKPSGHVFDAAELTQPGFETELCIRLRDDLKGNVTLDQVRNAVDLVYPAFEIVETRGDLVKQMPLALADNAQQRCVVLGEPLPLASVPPLDAVVVRVLLNGQEVATGFGSAVLGNPLNSIAWLSGKLAEFDRQLRSGDIVMTGSFVRQFPIQAGDLAAAEFSGVGRVEFGVALD